MFRNYDVFSLISLLYPKNTQRGQATTKQENLIYLYNTLVESRINIL